MKSLLFLKALLLACIALLPSCRILTNIPAFYGTTVLVKGGTDLKGKVEITGTNRDGEMKLPMKGNSFQLPLQNWNGYGTVYVAISGTVWTAEGDYVGTASVTIPVVTNASVPYVITFTDEGILLEGGYGYGSSRIIPWYRGKPCS